MLNQVEEEIKIENLELERHSYRRRNLFHQRLSQKADGYAWICLEELSKVREVHLSYSGVIGVLNQGKDQSLVDEWG